MKELINNFWKGKTILVTGAAGFIGSHLCERLVKEGCKVRAFVRYNSNNSYGHLESIPNVIRENIEIVSGDILDESSINKAMNYVDIVFHLAAIPSIPYSFLNPRHIFMVNTYGTFNVLLGAKTSGVNQVILASSAGASEKRPLLSPYVTSKAAMEKVGLGFHQGLELNVKTLRLMNNYGPRQSARAVIPCIISQALVRDDVHLGALEPKMDFNYVNDTIEALLRTAESSKALGKVLTWGSGNSISIKELAYLVFSLIGRDNLHIVIDKERIRPYPGPMPSLEEDILTTQKLLNYSPQTSFREGLRETIEWISEHNDHYKTDVYNV